MNVHSFWNKILVFLDRSKWPGPTPVCVVVSSVYTHTHTRSGPDPDPLREMYSEPSHAAQKKPSHGRHVSAESSGLKGNLVYVSNQPMDLSFT